MDDLLTIVIYLAILVIGGIASAYRKKGKKVQPGSYDQPKRGIPKPFDPFEELFKELEEKEQEEEAKPAWEPVEKYEPVIPSLETIPESEAKSLEDFVNEEEMSQEVIPVYNEIDEKIKSSAQQDDIASSQISDIIKDFDYDKEMKKTEGFDFDLKKAIIYSEILKRKDF